MDRRIKRAETLHWIVGAAIFLGALLSFMPLGAGAADEQPIKIEFSHGSGVNPRHFERWDCRLDTRSMKKEDASQLISLVDSSNILSSQDEDFSTTEGGPFYCLDIERAKQKRKFSWSYQHAPARIQPLVKFLIEHSQKKVYEMGKEIQ